MATEVLMPKLGLTMTEGTIEEWKYKEGDAVKKGDILFSVATDKLTNDVECEEDGTLLKILLPEGETAPCQERDRLDRPARRRRFRMPPVPPRPPRPRLLLLPLRRPQPLPRLLPPPHGPCGPSRRCLRAGELPHAKKLAKEKGI